MTTRSIRDTVISVLFVMALAVGSAPFWKPLLSGFNPTLDQLLEIRCRTR
jgi:hypothetical protein